MNLFQKIYYKIQISDNDKFLKAIEERDAINIKLHSEIQILKKDLFELDKQLTAIEKDMSKLIDENIELKDTTTELEKFCLVHYNQIPMIAYKQKREIRGKYYSIALNELITPDSYEVKQLFKGITEKDKFKRLKRKADITAINMTWDSDKNLDTSGDYYLYPNESIARKNCDCEDMTVINCSSDPEFGGAWGFYNGTGHAFNVFVLDNELWIADSTSKNYANIQKLSKSQYKINYIITKRYCFQIDGSTQFGELAGWN